MVTLYMLGVGFETILRYIYMISDIPVGYLCEEMQAVHTSQYKVEQIILFQLFEASVGGQTGA